MAVCDYVNQTEADSSFLIVTTPERCIVCRVCVDGCPAGALAVTAATIEREAALCVCCLNCVEICPTLTHEAIRCDADHVGGRRR